MTKAEMLRVIKEAGSKFHSLCVAIQIVQKGHGELMPDGLYKIAKEGNKLCGETLSRKEFQNMLCVRCSDVKPCPTHFRGC